MITRKEVIELLDNNEKASYEYFKRVIECEIISSCSNGWERVTIYKSYLFLKYPRLNDIFVNFRDWMETLTEELEKNNIRVERTVTSDGAAAYIISWIY